MKEASAYIPLQQRHRNARYYRNYRLREEDMPGVVEGLEHGSPRLSLALSLFTQGRTFEEIGNQLGCSHEYARQLVHRAFKATKTRGQALPYRRCAYTRFKDGQMVVCRAPGTEDWDGFYCSRHRALRKYLV